MVAKGIREIRRRLEEFGTALVEQFSIKMSRRDKRCIKHRAERLGMTQSDVIRRWGVDFVVEDEPRWMARDPEWY